MVSCSFPPRRSVSRCFHRCSTACTALRAGCRRDAPGPVSGGGSPVVVRAGKSLTATRRYPERLTDPDRDPPGAVGVNSDADGAPPAPAFRLGGQCRWSGGVGLSRRRVSDWSGCRYRSSSGCTGFALLVVPTIWCRSPGRRWRSCQNALAHRRPARSETDCGLLLAALSFDRVSSDRPPTCPGEPHGDVAGRPHPPARPGRRSDLQKLGSTVIDDRHGAVVARALTCR